MGSQEKESIAKKDADAAIEKDNEAKSAQEELEAALAEVKSQEDAYNSRTEELKKKSETGGVVSRNKAANELAQHLAEDPLPLRKAKITLEAAEKRATKARGPFEAATKIATDARSAATEARQSAEADAAAAVDSRKAATAARESAAAARESATAARESAAQARQSATAARES